jgi:GNAT superfamily N-acetyltransferase
MPPHFEIHRAAVADAAAISRVLYQWFLEFRHWYTAGGFAATALASEQILERMSQGPVWVASRDQIAGGTIAAVRKRESAYIRGMAVLPSVRRTGVAAALLGEAEKWAVNEGCRRVLLSTTPFLTAAIRLYETSGFRRTDESRHDLFGTRLFTVEKTLGA